ncbi:MAG: gliding motility-associated C-terminal domain-containing protein [Chitinophagaceae bacterium]|nr:gliding motility-associated C-terminal domain-containing protein [Chitinophagaceae bacterium]
MRKIVLVLTLLFAALMGADARHIAGGEIFYQYIGPGGSPGTSQYRITLRLFRDCQSSGAQLDQQVSIAIFNKSNNQAVAGSPFASNLDHIETIQRTTGSLPCIINEPLVCYQMGFYYLNVTLADNAQGYWVAYQRCCRVDFIGNLSQQNNIGATYVGSIAGTTLLGGGVNSSPQFQVKDTALVCQNRNFTLDFSATDPDSDSLNYYFCNAYDGGTEGNPVINDPPPPPYNSVPYGNGYSPGLPLGTGVSINPRTGIITGIAPVAGSYVIAVCVDEWRNGRVINTHRKDFILKVGNCDFVAAQLPINISSCDGFTVTFENQTPTSLINSWAWDFGVTGVNTDVSDLERPTFTFPDTGLYRVKLVVNPGDPCSDSAFANVAVYPGFYPGFVVRGICFSKPTQFIDTSSTRYGVISKWRWEFGETSMNSDTSLLQNPTFTYPSMGVKTVTFIVESNKGCVDTVTSDISIIDKPPIELPFRDTLICSIDSLQIPATAPGGGNFSWTPNYNILNENTSNPTVFPKVTTWYKVRLDDNGCLNDDSVRVRVVDFVTLSLRGDTTICAGDPVQLFAQTDGLQFAWTPAATLDDPTVQNPIASPINTTTYQVVASIGRCNTTSDVTILTVPYPLANAGNDTTICFGTTARLNGTVNNGATFSWSPEATLSNPRSLVPVASPPASAQYVLTSFENNGCPKPGRDTVQVIMLPKVNAFAGRDTAIVVGQPLQLRASGGETYFWYPPTGLNNVAIADPIAQHDGSIDSIRYWVRVIDEAGCLDSATLLVKIFKVNPQIFVPSAFTPNGDGLNDLVRPLAVGIEKIEYFRIYNRWGQLVFTTTINGEGWDGKINGRDQGTNTFVWLVKAIDYLGKPVFQKGTVTLIK